MRSGYSAVVYIVPVISKRWIQYKPATEKVNERPTLIVPTIGESVFTWNIVFGAVAFSFIAILGNLVFFILYFKLSEQGQFFALLRDNIGGILPNILATIPLGLVIGFILTQQNAYLWLLLFMGPLMLARYSFKVYLDSHTILLRTIASLVEAIEAKDPYTRNNFV